MRRGTSVSGLVAEFLRSISRQELEFPRLAALQRDVQAEIKHFRAADRLSRDEIHDRAVR